MNAFTAPLAPLPSVGVYLSAMGALGVIGLVMALVSGCRISGSDDETGSRTGESGRSPDIEPSERGNPEKGFDHDH